MEMRKEEFEKLLEALRNSNAHIKICFFDIRDNKGVIYNNCFVHFEEAQEEKQK